MKSLTCLSFKVFAITLIALTVLFSSSVAQTYEKYYLDGEIFVKFHDDYDPQIPVATDRSVKIEDAEFFSGLFSRHSVQRISRPFEINKDLNLLRTFQLKFEDYSMLDEVIEELEKMPEIEYAEKVALYYTNNYVPNDSLYNLITGPLNWNWHLDVINAEQAWNVTHGSPMIKIAVVDNAVWSDHPDLVDKIVLQRDVVNNTANSNPPGTGDPGAWSHGTHCSGLAAADTDNSIGVASIGFNSSIIAIKASHNNPNQISHSLAGVSFAINNGADVINMSFGGAGFNHTFQNIVNTGHNMGIVFVSSAGNSNSSAPHYPSGYANVISVASTNDDDVKSNFSNYGTSITVAAPGGFASPGPSGLLSTTYALTSMGYYDTYFGTSMAGPMVAGLAALMLSVNPELSPTELTNIMMETCDNIDAQNPNYVGLLGAGRINAYQAVLAVPFEPSADFSTPVTIIIPGDTIDFTDLSLGVPSTWTWSFPGGTPVTSNEQHPAGIIYSNAGIYDVSLTVENAYGTSMLTLNDYIVVTETPVPFLQFESSETNTCIYTDIIIEDFSLYDPTSWLWEFDPPNQVFVNGTDQNSQNPEFYFTLPGEYSVTFTATNTNGSNTATFNNYFSIAGAGLPYAHDFESGGPGVFELFANEKSFVRINHRAANESEFGLHFTGGNIPSGWSGTPTNTTPEQAWNQNTDFQANAEICNIDATSFAGIHLYFDLRQTFSHGNKLSWFRVLVNDTIQVADSEGNLNFNPETNEDPFVRRHFDLTEFAGTTFTLKLQSACRLFDYFFAEGDNAFVDNLEILGSLVGSDELINIPFNTLSISPNPAVGNFTVYYTGRANEQIALSLISANGAEVYSQQLYNKSGELKKVIDVSSFTPGLYIFKIQGNMETISRKVIIK